MIKSHKSAQSMQWFETMLGSYLLEREYRYFDKVVANIFGYNAIQISLPQFNFLRLNRMPLQFSISSEANHSSLMAEPAFLPIQSNSIDLVIMPHTLDFSANPHQILREVYRVLIPEGHVVMSGFNPFSLWGLARYLKVNRNTYPWNGNFIALLRLKDWLKLLDFETMGGELCCYAPPFEQEKWRQRFRFMEAAGDRWWPIGGGVYFLHAIKHMHGMRVIKPGWKKNIDSRARIVSVTQNLNK